MIVYFNSIKVQLEHISREKKTLTLKFQFHKGAIRTTNIEIRGIGHYNFNSIKVRLELRTCQVWTALFSVFQFHKGAIRTQQVQSVFPSNALFQFHKGAIRTKSLNLPAFISSTFQFHKGAIRTVKRLMS